MVRPNLEALPAVSTAVRSFSVRRTFAALRVGRANPDSLELPVNDEEELFQRPGRSRNDGAGNIPARSSIGRTSD